MGRTITPMVVAASRRRFMLDVPFGAGRGLVWHGRAWRGLAGMVRGRSLSVPVLLPPQQTDAEQADAEDGKTGRFGRERRLAVHADGAGQNPGLLEVVPAPVAAGRWGGLEDLDILDHLVRDGLDGEEVRAVLQRVGEGLAELVLHHDRGSALAEVEVADELGGTERGHLLDLQPGQLTAVGAARAVGAAVDVADQVGLPQSGGADQLAAGAEAVRGQGFEKDRVGALVSIARERG